MQRARSPNSPYCAPSSGSTKRATRAIRADRTTARSSGGRNFTDPSRRPEGETGGETTASIGEEIPRGFRFERGGQLFVSGPTEPLTECTFADYRLLLKNDTEYSSNREPLHRPDSTPLELKPLLEDRWRYTAYLPQNLTSPLTVDGVASRVFGGQILAYRYEDLSVYYEPERRTRRIIYVGFIPTWPGSDGDGCRILQSTHRAIDRPPAPAVWPRRLYLLLMRGPPCDCSTTALETSPRSPRCYMWRSWSPNKTTAPERRFTCGRKIAWATLYPFMGEEVLEGPWATPGATGPTAVPSSEEVTAFDRDCLVCAQCLACSIATKTYCRRHMVCKHRPAVLTEGGTERSVIKNCTAVKL